MQCPPKSPVNSLRTYFSRLGITSNFSSEDDNSNRFDFPSNARRAMNRYGLILLKKTHFSRDEIAVLMHIFYKLCKGESVLKEKDFKTFLISTFRVTNGVTLTAYLRAIDRQRRGFLSAYDFVKGMNVILCGNLKEKATFVFRMLDADQDGYLQRNVEMVSFISHMYETDIACSNQADPAEPDRDSIEFIMKKLDPVSKDSCSKATFVSTMEKCPLLMECCFPVWPDEKYVIAFQRLLLIPVRESSILLYNMKNNK